jgi:N-acetyl-gamma-glutamyl-phosphate reductase
MVQTDFSHAASLRNVNGRFNFFIWRESEDETKFDSMNTRIFIDGDQGTTGLDLRRRLVQRTDLRLITLAERFRKDSHARKEALNNCDVAMLCLPDAAAREAVSLVQEPGVRIIDASSAHRVSEGWTYGLPELEDDQGIRIRDAARISNPGCYPTGAILLLRPLIDAGLLDASQPLAIHAISGYSGQGRAGIDRFERSGQLQAGIQIYGLSLQHKHVPEIRQHAGLSVDPIFLPGYGAYRQGIVLTIPIHYEWLRPGTNAETLHGCLHARYEACAHVRVDALMDPAYAGELDPQALNGTDDVALTVAANDRTGQAVLCAVFDNLGKGAAGAAMQNLNLLLGTPMS